MANIFSNFGNKVGNAFTNLGQGGTVFNADPTQIASLSDEDKKRFRNQGMQRFLDSLMMASAIESENPQRLSATSNMIRQRKIDKENARAKAEQKAAYDRQYNLLSPDQKIIVDRQNAGIDLPTATDNSTEFERNLKRLGVLQNTTNLNDTEKTELNAIKTKLYGEQKVVPFFDSNGNPVNEIITNWDLKDNPALATNLTKQGFVTVGSGPASNFKAPINASQEISDKWESFTNEINLINDLGKLIVEGEDSITFAGKVADTLNTGIYQFKSAGRLLNFQQNDPQGYSKQINDIQNKHGSVLDKISADRGIGASLVMQLAYGLAKNVDPNARLTDRDIEAAIEMLGGSGGNAKKRLATFDKLVENRTREYDTFLNKQKLLYGKNKQVLGTINNFQTLPSFGYSSPQQNSQSADDILKELGIE